MHFKKWSTFLAHPVHVIVNITSVSRLVFGGVVYVSCLVSVSVGTSVRREVCGVVSEDAGLMGACEVCCVVATCGSGVSLGKLGVCLSACQCET